MAKYKVTIVGAGLAGSEAALVLSNHNNIHIKLIEMRPAKLTDVHKTGNCAELVCSNSFKSLKPDSAAGMLKYELEALASPVYKCAIENKIDAGNALAVDRDKFSQSVSDQINGRDNIDLIVDEFVDIKSEAQNCDALILCSGPLTSDNLANSLQELTGESELAFYDAAAPIVMDDSIDKSVVFSQDRYDNENDGAYLNAPMTKDEYENFIAELVNAECVIKKDFESGDLFQACQPVEEVARSGLDAPRFGAMKPIGLADPRTGERPYAVVQLRSENSDKTAWNLVGFQTNLTFGEQQRVFRMIPGLQDANFARFGVMHRNTFINSPKLLDKNLNLRNNIYVAGQLSGTEGYLEAVRSGHHAAISVFAKLINVQAPDISRESVFGALIDYATNEDTVNYQPMHVNFGILPPLEKQIKNKRQRYEEFAKRGKIAIDKYVKEVKELWKK